MGLSIHYKATLATVSSLNQLCEEVIDICNSLEWIWQRIHDNGDNELSGVAVTPPECETIFLTFKYDGTLCSPVSIDNEDLYLQAGLDPSLIYWSHVKTQYAGKEIHQAIIKLFRYLSQKYFSHFELKDEGLFWETSDEKIVDAQFKKYNLLLDAVCEALEGMEKKEGETRIGLVDRIEAILQKLNNDQKS